MNRIKELRRSKNLSQMELAQKVDVHQTAVSQWESGKTNPDMSTAMRLADIFEVSIDYLLGRTDTPRKMVTEIPAELQGARVAFHGGAFDGLDEGDIDMLLQMAEHLRAKKKDKP